MKTMLLGVLAAVLATTPALAADIAARPVTKAPPPVVVAPAFTWTGCYVGGNGGGGWSRIDADRIELVQLPGVPTPANYGRGSGDGWLFGGQIGCDLQVAGSFVLGIQGMFDAARIRSAHTVTDFPTFTYHTDIKWLLTVTGRAGFVVHSAALLYVKGGGAWKRDDIEVKGSVPVPFVAESATVTFTGWTVGGGLEYRFASNWSLFVEGSYYDFGSKRVALLSPTTPGIGEVVNHDQRVATVLAGINFRFGEQLVRARY